MKITLDGNYQTRSGLKVRIYAVDGKEPRPVHGAVMEHGEWNPVNWTSNGERPGYNTTDLITIPRTRKVKMYAPVQRNLLGHFILGPYCERQTSCGHGFHEIEVEVTE
jgi:hypothetical protein